MPRNVDLRVGAFDQRTLGVWRPPSDENLRESPGARVPIEGTAEYDWFLFPWLTKLR